MKNLVRIIIITIIFSLPSIFNLKAEDSLDKLKVGFTERFRFVSWDNSISLADENSDSKSFTRHRTSAMLQWNPNRDIEFGLKITNEFRNYLNPKNIDFEMHELIFDQLYFKWKNPGKLPLIFTIGRQNIILGEGFVVMDGHPLDGSRSIYFNAARVDFNWGNKNTLTAFFTYQPETDNILPVINNQDQALIESPEKGLGLYYSGKIKKTAIEAYFIRKDTDESNAHPTASGINALGTRISHSLTTHLTITAEGAYQWGNHKPLIGEKNNHKACGGYFHFDYLFKESLPLLRKLTVGGIYLSGDDPESRDIEGWDPLFSRWPKWSESYIYTQIKENSVGYWSNLNSLYVSLLMDVTQPVNLRLSWHHLTANELSPGAFPGGTGKPRGNLLINKLVFRINKYFTGHFLWEYFNPGTFYFDGADSAHWLRFELLFKI